MASYSHFRLPRLAIHATALEKPFAEGEHRTHRLEYVEQVERSVTMRQRPRLGELAGTVQSVRNTGDEKI
jgi:hypothetical protein